MTFGATERKSAGLLVKKENYVLGYNATAGAGLRLRRDWTGAIA